MHVGLHPVGWGGRERAASRTPLRDGLDLAIHSGAEEIARRFEATRRGGTAAPVRVRRARRGGFGAADGSP